jgi:N utilization substance protein A
MSELGGERIDIMEWSENPVRFIEDALSPAQAISVTLNEDEHRATVEVTDEQQSLAIGRGGQNVRLAAKLTGWAIDIRSIDTPGEKPEPEETAYQKEGKAEGELEADEAPAQPAETALETPEAEVAEAGLAEAVEESAAEENVGDKEENR